MDLAALTVTGQWPGHIIWN